MTHANDTPVFRKGRSGGYALASHCRGASFPHLAQIWALQGAQGETSSLDFAPVSAGVEPEN